MGQHQSHQKKQKSTLPVQNKFQSRQIPTNQSQPSFHLQQNRKSSDRYLSSSQEKLGKSSESTDISSPSSSVISSSSSSVGCSPEFSRIQAERISPQELLAMSKQALHHSDHDDQLDFESNVKSTKIECCYSIDQEINELVEESYVTSFYSSGK